MWRSSDSSTNLDDFNGRLPHLHLPVCGFPGLGEPPPNLHGCASYEIYPCCETEFGYDDATRPHADQRQAWVTAGCGRTTWFAGPSNLLFCDRTDSIEHEPTRRGYSRMRSSPPGPSAVFFSRKFCHRFNTDSTRIRCRLVKSWPR
jgi:hypothetical protein